MPEESLGDLWFQRPPHSLQILDRDRLAHHVAKRIVDVIREVHRVRSRAVLAPSAGRTLLQSYALLRSTYRTEVDWRRVVCVQMDEYAGIGSADPRSFASELNGELVEPLGMGRFIRFLDAVGRPLCSPDVYESQLRDLGGIDCALHGVGRNGHIALNEPATTTMLETRMVRLSETTRAANNVAFRRGVTLGLDILGEARSSVVVLLGSEKRKAAEGLLYRPMGPSNPVGHLRLCKHVSIYLDHEAMPSPRPAASSYTRSFSRSNTLPNTLSV